MKAVRASLVGRTIVDVEFRPFAHYDKGGPICHNPALVLDNGRRVFFVTEETGGPEYGTTICITDYRRPPKVSKPKRALRIMPGRGKIEP